MARGVPEIKMSSMLAATSARTRTTVLLNMASIMEKADEQVLPAVYFFIMKSLKCTPSQLGTMTLCRALVQVGTVPSIASLDEVQTCMHCFARNCIPYFESPLAWPQMRTGTSGLTPWPAPLVIGY